MLNSEPSRQDDREELNGLLELMSRVLRRFAGLDDDDIDTGIQEALESIGRFADVDRSYLFLIDPPFFDNTHEWCAPGITAEIDNLQRVPMDRIQWWMPLLEAGELVYIPEVAALPDERILEREELGQQGIQSLIVVPLLGPQRLHGFIGFDSVRDTRVWHRPARFLLRSVADAMLGALLRQEASEALRKSQERLRHRALHDPLTGLANRALLLERLEHCRLRARERGEIFAICFMDLDDFKLVNDAVGHHIGDQLLVDVAKRLDANLASGDLVARFGGDEFVLVFDARGRTVEMIDAEAQRLLRQFDHPFQLSGRAYRITASAGLVIQDGQTDCHELLRDADAAMYQAKALGGARLQHFDAPLRAQLIERIELAQDLRGSERRGEMQLHFQPFFDARQRCPVGVEALLRWQHPTRGLVSPAAFIPIAEETGHIVELGAWVLDRALAQLRHWQSTYPAAHGFSMAVNLSAHQLASNGLVEMIEHALKRHQVPPSTLWLELTESSVMNEVERARQTLDRLRGLGVLLAIDDFGTGYSSLAYLRDLPVNLLKLDRAFIASMHKSKRDQRIVAVVTTLARELGLKTIAEGVETSSQLRQLAALDCELVQGFHLMRPGTAEMIDRLLEHSPDASQPR
ncbi:putative bifunctional diguanylate cyclase/phosphodiesterase [Halochromatium sp.]